MPGNGLALAIGVGRKDQAVAALQCRRDVGHAFGRFGIDLPGHGKILIGTHRPILGRQIAHMAIRGKDGIVLAQVFVDRFGLSRRFDDDDSHLSCVL